MDITGHSTREMFDRYNSIDEGDAHTAIGKLEGYFSNGDHSGCFEKGSCLDMTADVLHIGIYDLKPRQNQIKKGFKRLYALKPLYFLYGAEGRT